MLLFRDTGTSLWFLRLSIYGWMIQRGHVRWIGFIHGIILRVTVLMQCRRILTRTFNREEGGRMRFRKLQWLFPLVVTLHNTEEAIWLPAWSQQASTWHVPVGPGEFRFAALVLTLLAFLVTYLSVRMGQQTVWAYLATGYMAAMIANVFLPHMAASVAMRSYTPGLVTAVLLNLPVLFLLLRQALREGYVSGWKAAIYWIGVPVCLLIAIPALFKLGRNLGL
jgi:uncharacterized protein with HXXEE motif